MKLLSICTFLFLCATFVNCSNSSDEDENEVSDTEDIIENNDLPEHEFVTEEKTVKSGKNKGQKKYTTTLMIPPYIFKRKVDKKVGSACLFTCNGCEKLGHRISASCVKVSEDSNGKCEYELTRIPNSHRCVPSSTSHLKKKFTKALYNEVANDPLKPVGKIYEELRSRFTSELDNEDEKMLFLNDIPTFKTINPDLYRHRQLLDSSCLLWLIQLGSLFIKVLLLTKRKLVTTFVIPKTLSEVVTIESNLTCQPQT